MTSLLSSSSRRQQRRNHRARSNTIIFTVGLLVILCILSERVVNAASGSDKCASENSFYCPNCGGIEVTDCLDCDGHLNTDFKNNVCFDRVIFQTSNPNYHTLWNDIVGAIVWFFAAGVATACGVGGGGIYVPLGIILLRFAPKPASGLSQASIFGASLGGLILNIRNRHPVENIRCQYDAKDNETGKVILPEGTKNELAKRDEDYLNASPDNKFYTRPLIDYDMALFLAPMEMAGAVAGVLIQKILPNWLYLMLAGVILGFTAYKTYLKFFDQNKKEKAARKRQSILEEKEKSQALELAQQSSSKNDGETENGEDAKGEDVDALPEKGEEENGSGGMDESNGEIEVGIEDVNIQDSNDGDDDVDDGADKQNGEEDVTKQGEDELSQEQKLALCRKYLEEDSVQYPKQKLLALLVLWIGLILLTFFKGGKGVDSIIGIDCTSPWYIVLIVLQFLWTIGIALIYAFVLMKKQKARSAVDYPFLPNDVIWDLQKVRFYAFFTFVAGIVAGLIGIGGGMVLGPLMLIMGIHPRVSSATTATMIVLTSSSVAVLFVTAGLVPWQYAVFFFCICLCGAYLGKKYIDGYVKKSGKASLLILILATIIALATIGCFVIVFTRLADANWCFAGFNKFCDIDTSTGLNEEESTACAAVRLLKQQLFSDSNEGSESNNVLLFLDEVLFPSK